ncbi:MAG TPA: tetratricopeptide repeat protein, partial [Bryobacteraceae bacterium]|nr:tetratricopeptide repeat protein [Bryobacteraceae bacterium]
FRNGLLALQRNDLAAARANLETASRLAPENGRVWVALSQTYWKLNDNTRADAAAAKAAKLGGADPVVLNGLVIYYTETGHGLEAAETQARYAELAPRDATARQRAEQLYFELARPLLQQGDFGAALTILQDGAGHLKNSAQIQLALGVALYGLRRFDDAAGAFLRTIAIDPGIEQPYTFLGKFLDQIPARLSEVTKVFAAYTAANPAKAAGYFLQAKALNTQAIDPAEARRLLEKAISIDDHDAAAHFELGNALERLRSYSEAAREFERAAELTPNDPAVHYRLSRVYDRLGRAEDAQAERVKHAALEKAQRDAVP